MKLNFLTCVLLWLSLWSGVVEEVSSQEVLWRARLYSRFDNTEFGPLPLRISRTMAGTRLQPSLGLGIDSANRIFVGADLCHEWGSHDIIDRAEAIAYYGYYSPHWEFEVGAFPRGDVFAHYPRLMFADSTMWVRPTVNGFSLCYRNRDDYAHLWLDWTGAEKSVIYESFYLGWAGKLRRGIFFGQHFGYMFHTVMPDYAADGLTLDGSSVKENIKTLTAFGVDLSAKTSFDCLRSSVAMSVSLERNRHRGEYHIPVGLLWQTAAEYRGLELRNDLYFGSGEQRLYNRFGNYLYWGDLMYKLPVYDRTDLVIHFLKSNILDIDLELSLHFAEGSVYNQQILRTTVDIDNIDRRQIDRSYRYIWHW